MLIPKYTSISGNSQRGIIEKVRVGAVREQHPEALIVNPESRPKFQTSSGMSSLQTESGSRRPRPVESDAPNFIPVIFVSSKGSAKNSRERQPLSLVQW